jgi:hypothetical protein
MNDSKNSSNGLLVLRYPERLSMEKIESLIDLISPMADVLGVEPLVLDGGADARLEYGASAVLERICTALEEIAAQGRMPEVNVAEIAPQALNARPTGLNERPVCKGSWELGTACGKCERCKANRPSPPPAPPMRVGG